MELMRATSLPVHCLARFLLPSIINSNVNSLTTQTNLAKSMGALAGSITRLSSGLRINSSADDAAGYAIAQGFTAQINGTNQAIRNANDAVSLSQTAGGSINQLTANLQRIRQLAVQSANATNSAGDRAALQQEVAQLIGDMSSISATTSFNGQKILDGSFGSQNFQIGANVGQRLALDMQDLRAASLGATVQASGSGVAVSGSGAASFAGGLKLNGTTIDTSSAGNLDQVVEAINAKAATSDVRAQRASSNVNIATYASDALNDNVVKLNGKSFAIAKGSTAAQVADAFNSASAQTGVSVSANSNVLTFTSENAADLTLADDAANGVLSNYNGSGNIKGQSAAFAAGIELSTKNSAAITVVEGSGTTASNLQILSGSLTPPSTSGFTASINLGGGSASYSNVHIGSLDLGGGSVTLTNVIVDSLSLGGGSATINGSTITSLSNGGGSANATGSTIGSASLGGGFLGTTNSIVGAVITGGGANVNNSPALAGSPMSPSSKHYDVASLDVSSASGAKNALAAVDYALRQLADSAADIGALQNRFTATVSNLQTTSSNLSSSRSAIQDADYAAETASLTRSQVINQAATAVLAQANQNPDLVLQLLR